MYRIHVALTVLLLCSASLVAAEDKPVEVLTTEDICAPLGRPATVDELLPMEQAPALKIWFDNQLSALQRFRSEDIAPEFEDLAKTLDLKGLEQRKIKRERSFKDNHPNNVKKRFTYPVIEIAAPSALTLRSGPCYEYQFLIKVIERETTAYRVTMFIEYLIDSGDFVVKEVRIMPWEEYESMDVAALDFRAYRHKGFLIKEADLAIKMEPGTVLVARSGEKTLGFVAIGEGLAQFRFADDPSETVMKAKLKEMMAGQEPPYKTKPGSVFFDITQSVGFAPFEVERFQPVIEKAIVEELPEDPTGKGRDVFLRGIRQYDYVRPQRLGADGAFFRMGVFSPELGWFFYDRDDSKVDEITVTHSTTVSGTDVPRVSLLTAFDAPDERENDRRVRSYESDVMAIPTSLKARVVLEPYAEFDTLATSRMEFYLLNTTSTLEIAPARDMEMVSITNDKGIPYPFEVNNGVMIIDLREEMQAGSKVAINAQYRGSTLRTAFISLERAYGYYAFREPRSDQFMPANWASWYPTVTDDYRYPIDFNLAISIPEQYEVLAVGDLVSEKKEDGWRHYRFHTADRPFSFPSYIVGYFHDSTWEDVVPESTERLAPHVALSAHLHRTTTGANPEEKLVEVDRVIAFFEEIFGPFPMDHLKLIDFTGFYGQGLAGMLFLAQTAWLGPAEDFRRAEFIAHEVSHQYWGHLVTWANGRDQWLSEAFANISAAMYIQAKRGDQAYSQIIAKWMQTADEYDRFGPIWEGRKRLGPAYTPLTYDKGGLVLHMLRTIVGPKIFADILKAFLEEYEWKMVSTEDFIDVVNEQVPDNLSQQLIGGTDFTPFFETYVYGNGKPDYSVTYDIKKLQGGGSHVTGKVVQRGAKVFQTPVPVTFHLRGAEARTIWLPVNEKVTNFEWKLRVPVRALEFNNPQIMWMDVERF